MTRPARSNGKAKQTTPPIVVEDEHATTGQFPRVEESWLDRAGKLAISGKGLVVAIAALIAIGWGASICVIKRTVEDALTTHVAKDHAPLVETLSTIKNQVSEMYGVIIGAGLRSPSGATQSTPKE